MADGAAAALAKASLLDLSGGEERREALPTKAHAPKKSSGGGILHRIRERQRQHKDDGKRHQRTTEDFLGSESARTTTTLRQMRSYDSTSIGGASRMDGGECECFGVFWIFL